MATNYTENPITDPDQMDFVATAAADAGAFATAFAGSTDKELIIGYNTKTIALKVVDNLTNDGATIKAVYSKLKDIWLADDTLIKFPFPMSPITDEQFEMINGWNWDKVNDSGTDSVAANTTELLRTGGWSVRNTSNQLTEEWAGIISLGTLAATDQVYYDQQNDETTDNTANFILKGKVNQAVQIYRDDNGDGTPDFNYRGFFKAFCREWKKTYAESAFSDIGVTTATFQAYRFPITNTTDLKVTHAEEVIANTSGFITSISGDGSAQTYTTSSAHGLGVGDIITISGATTVGYNATSVAITAAGSDTTFSISGTETGATSTAAVQKDVYGAMTITYAEDASNGRITNADISSTVTAGTINLGEVYQDTAGRWFEVTATGTIDASGVADYTANGGTATLVSYTEGEREISVGSGNYFAFSVIVDGDTGTASYNGGDASTSEIYEFVQYSLRRSADINSATPPAVIGKTADRLLNFVGDTLVTTTGVYIDSFKGTDINSIDFTDFSDTVRRFDFTAFLIITLGDNLLADTDAEYFVFFTNSVSPTGNDYGTSGAIIVNDASEAPMTGVVATDKNAQDQIELSYNYDGNNQRGNTVFGDVPITVVAIGLEDAQYVSTTGTIGRSKTNSVSLIPAIERNYEPGSV